MSLAGVTRSKLLLFAGIALGQFLLFEAGLRIKGGSEAAPAFQRLFMPDDRIGYRLKPGATTRFKTSEFETDISINAAGVRDDEVGPKAPNERRIVVLGDSLVMSVQVPLEETFCRQLEVRLNRHRSAGGSHYRVINAGVQGYGPVEEWLFYESIVRRLEPDVVLVALYVANDAIEAADASFRLGGTAGAPPPVPPREALLRAIRRVVRRSMVLQIARLRVVTLLERLGRSAPIERPLTSYLAAAPADVTRGLAVTREAMARLAVEAAARGTRVGLLLLPARFQLDDEDYGYLKEAVEAHRDVLVRDAASERFKEALAGLPVPVVDLLPALRRTPDPETLFFESTAHFTPRGHRVLAEVIERALFDTRLVPPAGPPARAASER